MTTRKLPTGERLTGERSRCAFTILELIVVLTIIGIVMGLAVPAYSRLAPRLRIFTARQQLLADLRHAHGQAAARRTTVEVAFSPSLYVIDGLTRRPAVDLAVTTEQAGSSSPSDPSLLRFYDDGSATPAAISLTNDGVHAHLRVDGLTGEAVTDDE
jgi:prepilin-type N-terminal cleavage/methylation domain-containing protein